MSFTRTKVIFQAKNKERKKRWYYRLLEYESPHLHIQQQSYTYPGRYEGGTTVAKQWQSYAYNGKQTTHHTDVYTNLKGNDQDYTDGQERAETVFRKGCDFQTLGNQNEKQEENQQYTSKAPLLSPDRKNKVRVLFRKKTQLTLGTV